MSGTSVTVYRNGTAISMTDTTVSTTITDQNGPLIIGDRPGAQEMSFAGLMDDMAIFDQALTPTQITTIMSGNFAEFGVVPEPSSAATLLLTLAAGLLIRRRSRVRTGNPSASP